MRLSPGAAQTPVDFDSLHLHTVPCPASGVLWDAAEFAALPPTHQAQIHFLNKEAQAYLLAYLEHSKMLDRSYARTKPAPSTCPFPEGYFKSVESCPAHDPGAVKKWLYQRGLPFRAEVVLIPNYGDYMLWTTWKMVLKYAADAAHTDDIVVFDASLNWCLFWNHDHQLYFGQDNQCDPEIAYARIQALYDRKAKYPGMRQTW